MESSEVVPDEPEVKDIEEQKMLLGWFRRHGVKKPHDKSFREALQCVIDARNLDVAIPWSEMERNFIPIQIERPVGYQKASDLMNYVNKKRAQKALSK